MQINHRAPSYSAPPPPSLAHTHSHAHVFVLVKKKGVGERGVEIAHHAQ